MERRLIPDTGTVLRLLALVYLYFGISQLHAPYQFVGWLPAEAALIPLPATTLILLNGAFEVFFGTLLLLGFYTRVSALLLGLHLAAITLSIGFTQTGVRDFGLTIATFALAIAGGGRWSLDALRVEEQAEEA